ncbi:MAG: glycoside hydrolase family 2 TIM barrel-domain containing protein [Planctomycetota bacterium]
MLIPSLADCVARFSRFSPRVILWVLSLCLIEAGIAGELATDANSACRSPARDVTSLDGSWEASLDGGQSWHNIQLPSPVENELDWDFDGVAQFRRTIEPVQLAAGQRLFVRFNAAATRTKVFFQDQLVGEHLGGWTPFECDITALARQHADAEMWQLRVEVDELVGHNTQGFLPIVIPHFGGLWQNVSLVRTADNRLLGDRILATMDLANLNPPGVATEQSEVTGGSRLLVRWGVNSPRTLNGRRLALAYRRTGTAEFLPLLTSELSAQSAPDPAVPFTQPQDRFFELTAPIQLDLWSPDNPVGYQLQLQLQTANGEIEDEVIVPICNRRIAATTDSITLNGRPLVIRGVLNWGYAPPSFAPSLDEQWMRREIELARERGFNLMKFCLWVPPRRYLELCDELGMLAWLEYPTWHPQLDQQHLPELQREFQEFFEYDRNHPSVLLRSLTCETGPGADINVIRDLYQRCKLAVPGAIVEDDSSWISWNRVSDFYDDHPYGNNHTWVRTLDGLKQYISEHDPKPLVLGEAIAADSFQLPGGHNFTPRSTAQAIAPRPAGRELKLTSPHAPWSEQANATWQAEIRTLSNRLRLESRLDQLPLDSRHYGLLMRKYQIETYRREVPQGGYVVSVIRDFPKAAMGLVDFANQPKHSASDWGFQGDGMILLSTQADRRSFHSNEPASLKFQLAWSGPQPKPAGTFRLALADSDGTNPRELQLATVEPTEFGQPAKLQVAFTPPSVGQPTRLVLQAAWNESGKPEIRNEWPIWVFPAVDSNRHTLVQVAGAAQLETEWPISRRQVESWAEVKASETVLSPVFSAELLSHLSRGGRAVIVPNNSVNSLPTSQHWFLRGSPLGFEQPQRPWLKSFPTSSGKEIDLLNELQHFDLAGPVVPAIEHFRDDILPLVFFWDNHDQADVRTHAAAFVVKVGAGRALVTTLNHGGPTNAAGHWLLERWLDDLQTSDLPATLPDLEPRLARELTRQGMILHERNWKFRPDPEEAGPTSGWSRPNFDDRDWQEIRANRHWEGQGFKELDRWAWYRLKLRLPEQWQGPCFLNLTGADDYCDVYVNGVKVGSCGDIAAKRTAFEERASFDLTSHVRPGAEFVIAIAVYDWYGAGGLFKPMTLSTQPLDQAPPMLK